MTAQLTQQSPTYEDAILRIVRDLPRERAAQVLDFARFISIETQAASVQTSAEPEVRQWAQVAVRSLAKYWDAPEEDQAWAHLQKAT